MVALTYDLISEDTLPTTLGLVVLQADETIEDEFKTFFPPTRASLLTSRVPSGMEVTTQSLSGMKETLAGAASLFPKASNFAAVGYACTSGTATIGAEKIAQLVRSGCNTQHVTDPVTALIAKCQKLGIDDLTILSPYVESVSQSLRDTLKKAAIKTSVIGSFNEPQEAKVARIDRQSIINAAISLASEKANQAIFISCTNLKTIDILPELNADLGLPVFSSNSVLADHMAELAGI